MQKTKKNVLPEKKTGEENCNNHLNGINENIVQAWLPGGKQQNNHVYHVKSYSHKLHDYLISMY